MRKLVFGFILGLVGGAMGYWYYIERYRQEDLRAAGQMVLEGAGKVKTAIQEKIGEIRAEDLKEELGRSGMVVREKARKAGEAIADATTDARITTALKAKLLKEPGLASMKVHVDTSEGLVTLSGTVSSHEELAKVLRLALETEGVHKVVSTLQVKPGG